MSDWLARLAKPTSSRIFLVVLDGLGGLPLNRRTELEQAHIPNLDELARDSSLGALVPIEHGITPGSGQAHIALFGYDPFAYQVGRGVLECLGVGLSPGPGDICCRANFCNFDGRVVTSRRAVDQNGERMRTELCRELCDGLQRAFEDGIEDVQVTVRSGEEHRFAVMFSGGGLEDGATDSDPGADGLPPRQVEASGGAEKTARVANAFIRRCAE
ncbi:MAG: phosphoglycerate mutase, partial [candidate division WOR-3 bacterium]